MISPNERAGLARALDLARTPGVPPGPNPRVGCVIIDPDGATVGAGFHRGAGTAHAEVAALSEAGDRARGATAVVSLEPCDHHGRTGPCTQALLDAGVARVVYAMDDPTELGGGGARHLARKGIEVERADGDEALAAREFLAPWAFAVTHGRPFVTLKMATTLDGRVAAADGTSRWITGAESRREVHRLRAEADAVVVGTGTVAVDDPTLTVRDIDAADYQPLRVVVGERDLPKGARLRADDVVHLRTHDPHAALERLWELGVRHVLLEGGPTVAAAWIEASLVDRLIWFIAPVILGAGPLAVGDLGITSLGDARRWEVLQVCRSGDDARIVAAPLSAGEKGP